MHGLIVKYDQDGNQVWAKVYGNNIDDMELLSITPVEDGYIITGNKNNGQNGFLLKVNDEEEILWKKDLNDYQFLAQITTDKDGNVVFTGGRYENDNLIGTITKMNKNGELLWNYLGESMGIFISVSINERNNIITSGIVQKEEILKAHVTEIDVDGEKLWEETINTNNLFFSNIENKNNLYLVGYGGTLSQETINNMSTADFLEEEKIIGTITKYNYVKKEYNIEVKTNKYGNIKVQEKSLEGEIIKLTITPEENYELASLKVTDENGKEITDKINYNKEKNTFIMPNKNIIINAEFDIINPQTGLTFPIVGITMVCTIAIVAYIIGKKKKFYHI